MGRRRWFGRQDRAPPAGCLERLCSSVGMWIGDQWEMRVQGRAGTSGFRLMVRFERQWGPQKACEREGCGVGCVTGEAALQLSPVNRSQPGASLCLSVPPSLCPCWPWREAGRGLEPCSLCSPSSLPCEALPAVKLLGRNFRGQVAQRWVGPCTKGQGTETGLRQAVRQGPGLRGSALRAAPVLLNTHIFRD